MSRQIRVFRLSANPPSLLPQRKSGGHLDLYLPSFSSQRESRAHILCQHGYEIWHTRSSTFCARVSTIPHRKGSGFPFRRERPGGQSKDPAGKHIPGHRGWEPPAAHPTMPTANHGCRLVGLPPAINNEIDRVPARRRNVTIIFVQGPTSSRALAGEKFTSQDQPAHRRLR